MDRHDASEIVDALFASWYGSLVRYGVKATGSLDLAEDLAQEAFLQLYQELRKGKTIEYPKAWTLSVVRRTISKQVRSYGGTNEQQITFETLEVLRSTAFSSRSEAEWDEVAHLFSLLTRREEEVLLLRMEALKYRDIAAQLGISAKSVSSLLSRALRKLQNAAKKNPANREAPDVKERRVPETLQ